MQTKSTNLKITSWAVEDRPREKLVSHGRRSLTDSELIAILIGSGNPQETAVELSRRILKQVDHQLSELSRLSIDHLKNFKGIGEAKAIGIVAALELGNRMKSRAGMSRTEITSSRSAFEAMDDLMCGLVHEEFWVLLLNRSNRIIERINISKGGVSGTVVDVKIIFKVALEKLASALILFHNHPSGSLKPSEADVRLTKRMKDAGKIMDIPILDHLIVSDSKYFSFADEGLL